MAGGSNRLRGGLPVSKWETSTDPGRGLVARISDDYEPQFPFVGEDLPCPAAWMWFPPEWRLSGLWRHQWNRVVGNSFRLPCSDSDDSDDDMLSVGLYGL